MSTVKVRLLLALESLLRVPPLLIIDEIFRVSFGVGNSNKQHHDPGYAPPQVQKTVYIRETMESSSAPKLMPEYTNDTLGAMRSAYPTTPAMLQSPASVPVVGEVWEYIADFLYNLFATTARESPNSATEPSSVSTSTIMEDTVTSTVAAGYADQPLGLVGGLELTPTHTVLDLMKLVEFLLCLFLFTVAVITFMLATENLIKLYSYLFSFLSLYLSYICAPFPTILAFTTIPSLVYNILCRSILAAVYYVCRSWPGGYDITRQNTLVSTMTEALLFFMFYVSGVTTLNPFMFAGILVALHYPLVRCLPDVFAFLKSSWVETKRVQNEYGLSHLIQVESGRLRVNTVFRLFWVTRAAYDAISKCCNEPVNSMVRYVMTHGTETFTGIVGLTVTVSAICHHIGECLLFVLYNGANTEADVNRFGSISTVLFFILSLQTGLTSLDPEKRLDRLMKNIVLLGTALFHALHQMISPVLTAFRAFQLLQIRAAVLSCVFFVMSGFLTYYLVFHTSLSTWSLAVLALAIEFKVKIFISLLISFVVYLSQLVQYPMFLEKFVTVCRRILPGFLMRFFDRLHDELSHEDVVFYLRSVANVAEFLTGIFLFVNAVWIFLFESASAIRAIGMSVHAYFNIWCEAQKGYRIYSQRKTASQKIMSLADATAEQLQARQDDVCAVCYEEMESAKVTNCNHLFHAVCLRKWLYVQNTCPLCHEVLYREDALENGNANGGAAPDGQQNGDQNRVPVPNVRREIFHAARRNNLNLEFEVNPSDDNDTEPEASGSRNNNTAPLPLYLAHTPAARHNARGDAAARDRTPAAYYNGGQFYDGGENETGNSSSGTEYTVDDGSDEDELWADDFSSTDDDDDARPRNRGDVIGVPLLL